MSVGRLCIIDLYVLSRAHWPNVAQTGIIVVVVIICVIVAVVVDVLQRNLGF